MRTMIRALLVAGSIAGLVTSGCGKEKLTNVEVPSDGVSLKYDLAAGQAYGGHIKVRSAAQTPVGEMIQKLEYDVELVVLGDAGDKHTVNAVVNGMAFEMRLPDGFPAKMLTDQGFTQETASALDGAELSFGIAANGGVEDMPDPPADANPGAKAFLGFVLAGLRAGLPRMPSKAVAQGESWDAIDKSKLEEGRTASGTGKLEGLARDEGGRDLAKLVYAITTGGKTEGPGGGEIEVKAETNIEALFATSDGFPTKVDSKIKNEAAGQTVGIEVAVEWKKLDKRDVGAAPATETQDVTDPCDPDYVGAEECVDDAAPDGAPEDAPADAPAEEATDEAAEG